MKLPLVYIAGPFRGPTPYDVKVNVHEAEALGLEVAKCGAYPVIPHTMTANFDQQLTDEFWLDGTMELLRRCDGIMLSPRWEQSRGAVAEMAEATRLGLPVFYRHSFISWRAELRTWVGQWQARQQRGSDGRP